ncbi:YqfQ family protein [Guptibacillus hwajinpoensis]|uniref:YqfQ family protein n=1 Tax=Guptibacillus hwajinpoensis TaxID=208199 RepID=UPI001CFE8C82|nr:YqfQ family protein [Pseudalkalibacillus hwajinpoensis]WLR60567.1 YqfQ family protein [Pseudalkalibacillus hwajinpoensis]
MNQFPPSPQSGPGPGMGFPFSGGGFQGPGPGFTQPQQTGGGGGLLSRFLGGGAPQGSQGLPTPPGAFPAMQRGTIPGLPQQAGMLSRILPGAGQGGMDMMGMIQNVQKVMQAADTIKPMVQQYGPMVKQLPEMIALFKEYQKSSGSSEEDETEDEVEEKPKKQKKNPKKKTTKKPTGVKAKKRTKSTSSNEISIKSKPKLYV